MPALSSGPENRPQSQLLEDLQFGNPREQQEALERLAIVGEAEALDAVVNFLRSQPDTSHLQRLGLETLRVLANKYLPLERYSLAEALTPFLISDSWDHRLTAARLLNAYPSEIATSVLLDLVDEARQRVYDEQKNRFSPRRMLAERTLAEAVMALANCGKLHVLPEILDLLDDAYLRPLATRALGVIGSETERPHLEDLIEDPDPRVRDAAHWALGLMDERIQALLNPPQDMAEPPPDRLHPLYWVHRQLVASSDDDLIQFLVVRVAIEHLILDNFMSEGRVPEACSIVLRTYEGDTPPSYRDNQAELVGAWLYGWNGPDLQPSEPPPQEQFRDDSLPTRRVRGSQIVISYPESLAFDGSGTVSFDCHFESYYGKGWLYSVAWQDGEWVFGRIRQTWAS